MAGIGFGEITTEEKRRVEKCFPVSLINDLIRYDNGFVMPRSYPENHEKGIFDFDLREDDIWIVTYPKCGTTWTQELVWMLVNDVNIEAGKCPLPFRSPMIEAPCVINSAFMRSLGLTPPGMEGVEGHPMDNPIEYLNDMKGRRVIKTHIPLEFLPPKLLDTCKVVYVARNPKDCAVSFYHHNLLMPGHGYVGSFEQFMEFFKEGLHVFGSYWHHILGGWKNKDHKNLKFMWFEDMKKDQKGVIKELCDFLDHPLSEDLMDRLCDHVKFENMKKNPHANPSGALHLHGNKDKSFMRKGEVGDWKNFFDDERNSTWNKWIKQNIEGTGLEQVDYLKFS